MWGFVSIISCIFFLDNIITKKNTFCVIKYMYCIDISTIKKVVMFCKICVDEDIVCNFVTDFQVLNLV